MNSVVLRQFVYASRLNDRNISSGKRIPPYTFQILDTPGNVLCNYLPENSFFHLLFVHCDEIFNKPRWMTYLESIDHRVLFLRFTQMEFHWHQNRTKSANSRMVR